MFNLLSRVSSFLTTIRGLVGGQVVLLLLQSLDDELGQVVVAVVAVSTSLVQALDGGCGNPSAVEEIAGKGEEGGGGTF